MSESWFGEFINYNMKREFHCLECVGTVGLSHGDSSLVVKAIDGAAGELLACPEIVQKQLAMGAYGTGEFLHWFDPGAHRFGTGHETIAHKLKMEAYLADSCHSWERTLNENSNGLLWQYFQKGMDLVTVTQVKVQRAVDRRDHRPRKVLEFRTPFEVVFGKTVRYTKPPLRVAH